MNDDEISSKSTAIKVFLVYFIMGFIGVTLFVWAFVYQKPGFFDGKTTIQDDLQNLKPVGNESDPQNSSNPAFSYWYAPPNSFGIQETKTVNWSWFWKVFRKNCMWQLEAWHPVQQVWVDNWQGTNLNEWLNITRVRNESNSSEKITLNVTNMHPTQDLFFRFKFGIDICVKDYVNKSSWYEYTLIYPANETENYTVFFNFSDVKPLISNGVLLQKHGVKGDLFYFMLTQNMTYPRKPLGSGKSFEIDPNFGTQTIEDYADPSQNIITGLNATAVNGDGIADSITVYLAGWDAGEEVTCALYYADNDTLIEETEERTTGGGTDWYVFSFPHPGGTKPNIVNNTEYKICIWADNLVNHYISMSGGEGYSQDSETYDPPGYNDYPAIHVHDGDDWNGDVSIYCTYTEYGTVFAGTNVFLYNTHQRKLVRQSNGTFWCTFVENDDVHMAYSEDDGVTWTDIEIWGAEASSYPTIAVDSNDVVHLVFQSNKNDADDLQLEYSNSSDWTTIVQIRDEDKYHTNSFIAVDSNDTLHIVYEKGEEGTSGDDQVAYVNSTDNGGSWSTEQILTDEANDGDDLWLPSITIDSNDVIHVVFGCEDHYTASGTDDDILHMQSDDGGITWTNWEADPIYQDASHNQKVACSAIDDNDVLHVVWYGQDQNTNDQVGYSFNDSSGWSTVEWVTEDATLDYRNPTISVNDNDYIHTAIEVVATRLNHSVNDTTSWTMDMVLSGDYGYPNMISAQHPIISGAKTNRPKTGYACIYDNGGTNVTFYASSDLTWETGGAPANNPPVQSGESPVNATDCVDVSSGSPDLYVICTDADSDTMNATWKSNSSGSWVDFATNLSISTGTNITQNNANFSTESTTYWWSVNLSDGTDWDNETYHFITCANASWQMINYSINGTCTNTTMLQMIDYSINGTCSNITTLQMIDYGINGTCTNTTTLQVIDYSINGTCTNSTLMQMIDYNINGTCTNSTTFQMIDYSINGTCTNVSGLPWTMINYTINGTCTNTTDVYITITSPFPSDTETNAPIQPTIYATINSTTGQTMNVSWYWGTTVGNENTFIGTDTNFTNSTQIELFFEANTRITTYYWRAQADDGTNYQNETFSFRTEGLPSGGVSQIRPNYTLGVLGLFGLLGVILFFIKRKRDQSVY